MYTETIQEQELPQEQVEKTSIDQKLLDCAKYFYENKQNFKRSDVKDYNERNETAYEFNEVLDYYRQYVDDVHSQVIFDALMVQFSKLRIKGLFDTQEVLQEKEKVNGEVYVEIVKICLDQQIPYEFVDIPFKRALEEIQARMSGMDRMIETIRSSALNAILARTYGYNVPFSKLVELYKGTSKQE